MATAAMNNQIWTFVRLGVLIVGFVISSAVIILTLRSDVNYNSERIMALEKTISEKFETHENFFNSFLIDMRSEVRKDSTIMNTRINSIDSKIDSHVHSATHKQ